MAISQQTPSKRGKEDGMAAALQSLSDEIAAQPWAKSRKRCDIHRRAAAYAMVHALHDILVYGNLTLSMIDRQRRRIFAADPEPIQSGLSVGYKRGKKLKWIDVPGEFDPVTASQAARKRAAETLLQQGYREYGISPVFTHPARPL